MGWYTHGLCRRHSSFHSELELSSRSSGADKTTRHCSSSCLGPYTRGLKERSTDVNNNGPQAVRCLQTSIQRASYCFYYRVFQTRTKRGYFVLITQSRPFHCHFGSGEGTYLKVELFKLSAASRVLGWGYDCMMHPSVGYDYNRN